MDVGYHDHTGDVLDLDRFSRQLIVAGQDRTAEFCLRGEALLRTMMAGGMLTRAASGALLLSRFGYNEAQAREAWRDPYLLTSFVWPWYFEDLDEGGEGDYSGYYTANAAGKLAGTFRYGIATLEAWQRRIFDPRDCLRNQRRPGGYYRFGLFPEGGGLPLDIGGHRLAASVSTASTMTADHTAASILGTMAGQMHYEALYAQQLAEA